jgi:hypothetical protein
MRRMRRFCLCRVLTVPPLNFLQGPVERAEGAVRLLYLAGRRKRLGRDDLDAAIAIPQDAQCRDFDPVFPRSAEITSPAGRMTLAGKGKVNPRARIPHPDTKQMVLLIFADLRFPVKDQQPFAVRFPLARQSRLGSGKLTKQQKTVCCEPLLHPYRSTVR